MARDDVVRQLARAALRRYPREAAALLDTVPADELSAFIAQQEEAMAADLLRRLRADRAAEVVERLPEPAATRVLTTLEPAIAVALVARLPDEARHARLRNLDAGLADELVEMMAYPPHVVGAIMDPRVENFHPHTPAHDALARIRTIRDKAVHTIYIVNDDGVLTGSVAVHDLALSRPGARLEDLAHRNPASVRALDPHNELAAIAEDRRVSSVPVVDIAGRLMGVVRYPELLRAMERDATADIQTMVGVSKEERALSPATFAVRKRLPWLTINLGTAFLAAAVVGLFENTIAQFTALAVLLPVVAGQSGNTGAQALAVTMRGLALREIRVRHWFRTARKELMAGAINGLAVATVTALGVLLWSRSPGLAAVIGVSMVFSMVVAGLAGTSVPMALILLRQDPAAASSIVLTTVTDIVGFMSFLGFATIASGML
jgi:magnesium transporter